MMLAQEPGISISRPSCVRGSAYGDVCHYPPDEIQSSGTTCCLHPLAYYARQTVADLYVMLGYISGTTAQWGLTVEGFLLRGVLPRREG